MGRIVAITNRCNGCGATHRPKPDEDDSDRLEDGETDTGLPAFWLVMKVTSKVPNPEYAANEAQVERAVRMQWASAAQAAAQAKGGPLDAEDVQELKDFLESQIRDDDDPSELTVRDVEVFLCPKCAPKSAAVGINLVELSPDGATIPAVWAPAATPAVPVGAVGAPAVGVPHQSPAESSRQSAPPLPSGTGAAPPSLAIVPGTGDTPPEPPARVA